MSDTAIRVTPAPRRLEELHRLPDDALITRAELAAMWRTTEDALAQRDLRGEGIRRLKIGRLVRYCVGDARDFVKAAELAA